MARKAIDITGQTFGRLIVLGRATKNPSRDAWWVCQCECGNTVERRGSSLRRGHCQSCGCLHRETASDHFRAAAEGNIKHGHALQSNHTRTYDTWQAAKQRCTNPNNQRWKDYGGRGIRMCVRWLNSFEAFLADMGEKPEGLSLDRYPDNDGNYEPGNCRWATPTEQRLNQRPRRAA